MPEIQNVMTTTTPTLKDRGILHTMEQLLSAAERKEKKKTTALGNAFLKLNQPQKEDSLNYIYFIPIIISLDDSLECSSKLPTPPNSTVSVHCIITEI